MPPVPVPTPHPVKAVLAQRRITITGLSQTVRVNPGTLGRVFNGYVEPWPAVRRRVSEALDLPEDQLFRDPS